MPVIYTADELITSIRNLSGSGDTGSTGTEDPDIIRHINEALKEKILPEISTLREDYFIKRSRTAPVNGRVRIDARAMWGRLRDLYYVPGTGSQRVQVDPVDMDEIHQFPQDGGPYGYYLEGEDVVLVGGAPSTSLLEQAFLFRPGDLVATEETRRIIDVDLPTKTVTLDSNAPATWDNTMLFDVHAKESGAEIITWSEPIASVSGDTVVFTNAIDGSAFGRKSLAVGQYLCLEGEAAIPGIPRDWMPLVIRVVTERLAEAIADAEMVQVHGTVAEGMVKLNKANAEQRVESKPMRVSGRRGVLRAMRGC